MLELVRDLVNTTIDPFMDGCRDEWRLNSSLIETIVLVMPIRWISATNIKIKPLNQCIFDSIMYDYHQVE